MINAILALGSALINGVSENVKAKTELRKNIIQNKARLAIDKETNNHEWEMANLEDKDKWMRRISFVMFTWPFIWIYFDADAAKAYFTILDEVMPAWYKQTYMAMTGGIWGLSALKNTIPNVVSGIANALRK